MRPQELGAQGEKFILDLLTGAGLDVEMGGPGDLVISGSGLTLEVKASLPRGKRQRFQFCLYRANGRQVKTDARRADLVILLAYHSPVSEPAIFVIPSSRLDGQKSIKLPASLGRYTGRWQWYRDAWERALDEMELRE